MQRVVFATERPASIANICLLLRAAEIDADLLTITPSALRDAIPAGDPTLVILDGESNLPWSELPRIRQDAPRSRFVVWSANVTTQLVHAVLTTGVHGLMSADLAPEESSAALQHFSKGQRGFCYSDGARR